MHVVAHLVPQWPAFRWWRSLLSLALICASFAGGSLPRAAAAATTVVVTASAPNGWLLTPEAPPQNTGSGSFVSGPGTPPIGSGSAQFTVDATGSYLLMTTAFNGTRLAAITRLSYSTYRAAGGPALAPALQFNVDYDLTDTATNWQGRLNYEPYMSGTVLDTTWQTWDTLNGPASGSWWASGAPGNTVCPQANPCTTAELLAAFPNVGIHTTLGALLFKAGSGWAGGFTGNVDNLTIGIAGNETTFDFEAETPCTTTCYVDASTGNDTFGGGTTTNAKKTIQAALNQVSANGTVIVAAGSYAEQVVINKDGVTLRGAGIGQTTLQGTACAGTGLFLTGTRSDITIAGLTVTGFENGVSLGQNVGFTIQNIVLEDVATTQNCRHGIISQAGTTNGLRLTRVNASNNGFPNSNITGSPGRGVWIINGNKSDVVVENGVFSSNLLTGIDFGDGDVNGLRITGNTVAGNGDADISVLGAEGPQATVIDSNTITSTGRFGIEVKASTGNGSSSGAGSVVVSRNSVVRVVAATDARDLAGIAVIRRSGQAIFNADQPSGTVVLSNTLRGFHRKPSGATGDGFGIVVEGANQTVRGNSVADSDIAIQVQGGNSANTQNTPFFDRGDAASGGALVENNAIASSDVGIRTVGVSAPGGTVLRGNTLTAPGNGASIGLDVRANTVATLADAPMGNSVSGFTTAISATGAITVGTGTLLNNGTTGLLVSGASAKVTLLGAAFSGQSGDYITLVNHPGDIDGRIATFAGTAGADLDDVQFVAVQGKITDKNDNATLGLVRLSGPALLLNPFTLTFNAVAGAAAPTAQSFTVRNPLRSGMAIDWNVSAPSYEPSVSSWLSCTPTSGTALAPGASASITCQSNSLLLAPGVYTATLTVASPTPDVAGNLQTIKVVLRVAALGIALSPASSTVQPGTTTTLRVTIAAPQQSDTVIGLSSSNPAIVSLPTSVVIPVGQTSATVSAAGSATSNGLVSIKATLPQALGGGSALAQVSVGERELPTTDDIRVFVPIVVKR